VETAAAGVWLDGLRQRNERAAEKLWLHDFERSGPVARRRPGSGPRL